MRFSIIAISMLTLVSACASKQKTKATPSVDSLITIEEEIIVNPNEDVNVEEKTKIVRHYDGIRVIDVIDFAFDLYLNSEIQDEQWEAHKEKLRENLPSGARVHNP